MNLESSVKNSLVLTAITSQQLVCISEQLRVIGDVGTQFVIQDNFEDGHFGFLSDVYLTVWWERRIQIQVIVEQMKHRILVSRRMC